METAIELNQLEDELLQATIEELKNGKCVLFLGPELLISHPEEKYYKVYFKELAKQNERFIFKYFSRDNVFSFKKSDWGNRDAVEEQMVRKKIKNFYETTGDEIILNLIAQLRF